jgi:nitrite reductase/ring-hydroxylating ferredoxin subunit
MPAEATGDPSGALTVPKSELTGEACQVVYAGDVEILIITVKDKYFAVDNQCTHAESWLDTGDVEAKTMEIVCPLHGGAFDIKTGSPTRPPCTISLRTYVVEEGDEAIHISVGAGRA